MADNKHLTLSDRIFIEKALNDGKSRKAIAEYLGKDKSTICKEIKKHTVIVPFTRIQFHRTCTYDCTKIKECGFKGFVLPFATGEFLSHAEEKILQAASVTDVLTGLPASSQKNYMLQKKHIPSTVIHWSIPVSDGIFPTRMPKRSQIS